MTAESGAEEATANAIVLATTMTTGGGKITPVAEQDEDEADESDDSSDSVLLESIQKRQNYIFSRDLMSVFNLTEATNNTGNNNSNNNNTTTTLTMTTSTSQTQPKQLQQQPSRATKIYSNDLNTETDNLPSFSESISCAPAAVATTETTSLYNTYHNQPTTTMTAMSAATQSSSSSSSSTSKQQAVKIRKELAEKKKHQQPSLLREEIKEEELSASAAVTTTAPTTSSANSVNNVTAPSVHNTTFNEDSQPKSSHLPSLSSSAAVSNENKAKSSSDELVLIDFDQFETGN